MKRSVWKWTLGISLVVFVLLVLFTLGIWLLINTAGVLFITLLSMGNIEVRSIPLGEFLQDFVGSPMFYLFCVDLTVLFGSVIALIVTRNRKNQ